MTDKTENKVLEGREGLAVYLRYLGETVPDLFLAGSPPEDRTEAQENGDRLVSEGGSSEDREIDLAALREKARTCTHCSLSSTRTNVVFGEGNPDAALMFVGEGPGADEDATGRPFVGRAGELLTKMIGAMGYARSDVYIANIVKCRPPGNRVPEENERQSCLPYLQQQISLVSPQAIVLLGQTAAASLLGQAVGISKLRGKEARLSRFPDIRVMPTYHPAYLLRNPSAKAEVWEDLKKVMAWLGKERS
ncbi:MAG: uracil-DNA glycosylase [Nitrospiraceae bacterium]|nr:uracil-DNA glycosylase [Nitrospiraceae bacterium]